ncbi:MAG: tRNA (N(6)-L-threonylcarbamoyladenosine(37)-C(2))-methylthiotransferase [Methanomicrobia archaeon]|nr:tRNA (N(6)-L-threonylcarbamoyladenosine(37)-C(2))-methylthiotransferase [Methanomicrobia archaeon]
MPFENCFPGPQKIHLETFGCTANIGDTLKLQAVLRNAGHTIVEGVQDAEVVILNTCTVTRRTELNVLKRLRTLQAMGKAVVVAGCMAAAQRDLLTDVLGGEVLLVTPTEIQKSWHETRDSDLDGVISVIPIALGCLGTCAYCIVKQARGELRSYRPAWIIEAVSSAVARGAKEIRITAQDCSAYGFDAADGVRLPQLLERLTALEGDFHIRVGMMNPATVLPILDQLLDAFESEKIFKFFHVPVQSGSDEVLRAMRRNYRVADFVTIVTSLRDRFSDCTISTDFIVGYPTETEAQFLSSVRLLEAVHPEKVNITKFSPRPGTEAETLKDLLERDKKRRSRILTAHDHDLSCERTTAVEGTTVPVLITEQGKKGGVIGRDPAYRMVVVHEELPLGSSCEVTITSATSTYLIGRSSYQDCSSEGFRACATNV